MTRSIVPTTERFPSLIREYQLYANTIVIQDTTLTCLGILLSPLCCGLDNTVFFVSAKVGRDSLLYHTLHQHLQVFVVLECSILYFENPFFAFCLSIGLTFI